MKRGKIASIIVLSTAFMMALNACDNVDKDDRYIEIESVKTKRAVLLEEFTGQNCRNCPEGHEIVTQLKEQYGDAFIPVSIHASQLSYSEEQLGPFGLGISAGNEYWSTAGSPPLPSGVVDRISGAIDRDQWATAIRTELEKESPAAIEIKSSFDTDGKIHITTGILSTENITCNLTVWITENNIVGFQNDHGTNVSDYKHNHVLRAVVTPVMGETIIISKGIPLSKSYTYDTVENNKSHWNPVNLNVVAFISNDTNGVLQAAESHIQVE